MRLSMRLAMLFVIVVVACGGPKPAPAPEPERPRKIVQETTIEIFDPLGFVGDTMELAGDGTQTIAALAQTMTSNPDLELVEVQVYVADNQELADRRAKMIVDLLVAKSVPAERLRTKGLATAPKDPKAQVFLEIVKRADQK